MRPPVIALVGAALLAASPAIAAGQTADPILERSRTAGESEPTPVDCRISAKKRYSIDDVVRDNGFRIRTRCAGPTRVRVMFNISGPGKVVAFTPAYGVQDAGGGATFERAGKKVVRLKLHPKSRRALEDARWAKGHFHVGVEVPGQPGLYYSAPEDMRKTVLRA